MQGLCSGWDARTQSVITKHRHYLDEKKEEDALLASDKDKKSAIERQPRNVCPPA